MSGEPIKLSATKIKTWQECRRKHLFQYVLKIKAEEDPKALVFGDFFHRSAEAYMRRYPAPEASPALLAMEPDADTKVARMIDSLVPFLPTFEQVEAGEVKIEGWIENDRYRGKIDLLYPVAEGPFGSDFGGRIDDLKSRSSKKWASTPEDLRSDPQPIIYCRSEGVLNFRHLNVLKSGTFAAWPVEITFGRQELEERYQALPYDEIVPDYLITDAAEVPGNMEHCSAYGGCPFRPHCAALGDPVYGLIATGNRYIKSSSNQQTPGDDMAELVFKKTAAQIAAQALKAATPAPRTEPAAPPALSFNSPEGVQTPARKPGLPSPPKAPEMPSEASVLGAIAKGNGTPGKRLPGASTPLPGQSPGTGPEMSARPTTEIVEIKLKAKPAPSGIPPLTREEYNRGMGRTAPETEPVEPFRGGLDCAECPPDCPAPEVIPDRPGTWVDRGEGKGAPWPHAATPAPATKGRPKGSKNKVQPVETGASDQPTPLAPEKIEEVRAVTPTAPPPTPPLEPTGVPPKGTTGSRGYRLYIDCFPGEDFVELSSLVEVCGQKVSELAGPDEFPRGMPRHYLALDFGKGPLRVAALLRQNVGLLDGKNIVCRTGLPATKACMEALLPGSLPPVWGIKQ